jgi:hypothetical protein
MRKARFSKEEYPVWFLITRLGRRQVVFGEDQGERAYTTPNKARSRGLASAYRWPSMEAVARSRAC